MSNPFMIRPAKLYIITISLFLCFVSHIKINAQSCAVQDSLNLVTVLSNFSSFGIDTSEPISQWAGINLNADGCVISIDFYDCCVSGGVLSPAIGELSSLEYLNLDEDNLSGEIPIEVGNLTNLIYLNLSENSFSGEIPVDIKNLVNLEYLNLGENSLTGSIPAEIGELIHLKYFNICTNKLEGNLPAELGNLNELTSLYTFGNNLSGCYDISLSNLCHTLSDMINTNYYISRDNNFDVAWEDFCSTSNGSCSCRYTDSLNLITFFNSLQQDFDVNEPLENWQGITLNENGCVSKIDINDRFRSGFIGPEIGNFSELVFLKLNENRINGIIPPEIGNLINLEYLSLTENGLYGSIPASFSNLTNLNTLYLDDNYLDGCYDPSLSSLCNIPNYRVSLDNNFAGSWDDFCATGANACLPCYEQDSLTLLTILSNLANHSIDTTLPLESWTGIGLNDNGCVTMINWNECCIYGGTLSPAIGDLKSLEYLNLGEGSIGGEIPEEIGNLPNLKFLNLVDNAFVGEIPVRLFKQSRISES